MIGPAEAGLQIAEHRVDPLEFRQILGLVATDNRRVVNAPCRGHRSEVGEAVGGHDAAWRLVLARPHLQGLEGDSRDRGQLHPQWMRIVVPRYRRYERDLVLGTAPDLAATAHPAEVGVTDLDTAVQQVAVFPLRQGRHQFVMDAPVGWIADPELVHQRQGRETVLGLAEQVDGEKPRGQRQFSRLHHVLAVSEV